MFLGMQDFDFAQSDSTLQYLTKFARRCGCILSSYGTASSQ